MEDVNGKIQALRSEYAAQVRYFSTVVEHVQTGLVSFGPDKKVELMNQAAKRILGIRASRELETIPYGDESLHQFLSGLEPSDNRLIRLTIGMEQVFLSVQSTILGMGKIKRKIVSFHNIRSELDEHESESWQRLIHVLNHEIMNSVAPVLSTITTLSGYFREGSENPLVSGGTVNEAVYSKTVTGLELIRERSEGLRQFVDKYKNLYEIGAPEYSAFLVKDLFNSCQVLIQEHLKNEGISWNAMTSGSGMQLFADKKLFLQVLINLIKNAIEALSESGITDKTIELKAYTDIRKKHIITITDNGPGIPSEIADQVFIPFYTTKRNGSGIGLSLSKMILARMGWSIRMTSKPFERTTFVLEN
jgi:signal transduction histidine kinase